LDAASAASAPSFATVRIRTIVDRSTCCCAATSATVTSWRTSCSHYADRATMRRPASVAAIVAGQVPGGRLALSA